MNYSNGERETKISVNNYNFKKNEFVKRSKQGLFTVQLMLTLGLGNAKQYTFIGRIGFEWTNNFQKSQVYYE